MNDETIIDGGNVPAVETAPETAPPEPDPKAELTPEQMAFLDDWVRSSASGLREGDPAAAATLLGLL